MAPNDAVSTAIQAKLPEDATAVALLYGDALAAADWHTCNAIESLPVVHAGRLDADLLVGLRRERSAVEAPEAARAIEVAEEVLGAVEGAHASAAGHLADLGRGLPDPDAEDGVEVG